MDLKAMQDELIQVSLDANKIRLKYQGKHESMTAEESAQVDRMLARYDELKDAISTAEASATKLSRLSEVVEWGQRARDLGVTLHGGGGTGQATKTLKMGTADGVQDVAIKARTPEERAAWRQYFAGKSFSDMSPDAVKGLFASDMTAGGALIAPMEIGTQILANVKDLLFFRQIANVLPPLTKSESLGVVTLDTDLGDPTWTSELDTGSADTVKPFGRRALTPHALARRIKISKKLLRIAAIDPEGFVMDRLAYRRARVEENAFLNGSGSQQPLGVFTASSDGIPTTQDFVAANATSVTGDDYIGAKHTLKTQYWGRAKWIMHRTTINLVRKLKDSQNNYLWQPGIGGVVAVGTGLTGGNPETILDCPVMLSELAPNTVTAGLYTAILGDFSYYWIVDALDMTIERLMELYAETNEVGYILRSETDGAPMLAEAFVRFRQA